MNKVSRKFLVILSISVPMVSFQNCQQLEGQFEPQKKGAVDGVGAGQEDPQVEFEDVFSYNLGATPNAFDSNGQIYVLINNTGFEVYGEADSGQFQKLSSVRLRKATTEVSFVQPNVIASRGNLASKLVCIN